VPPIGSQCIQATLTNVDHEKYSLAVNVSMAYQALTHPLGASRRLIRWHKFRFFPLPPGSYVTDPSNTLPSAYGRHAKCALPIEIDNTGRNRMNKETVNHVQQSWAKVVPIAPEAAALFYNNLFTADPSLKPLFKGDMNEQGKKLMQMIGAAVGKLGDLDTLVPILQGLGKRHGTYGVVPAHYGTVGSALLMTLSQGLGSAFTPAVKEAWTEVYGVMAKVMIEAGNA
jgi:hemoglobin-like flavoprotein